MLNNLLTISDLDNYLTNQQPPALKLDIRQMQIYRQPADTMLLGISTCNEMMQEENFTHDSDTRVEITSTIAFQTLRTQFKHGEMAVRNKEMTGRSHDQIT